MLKMCYKIIRVSTHSMRVLIVSRLNLIIMGGVNHGKLNSVQQKESRSGE